MNTKQLIASGMAVLMLAGSIFGNSAQMPVQAMQQEDDIQPDMRTEFIQLDIQPDMRTEFIRMDFQADMRTEFIRADIQPDMRTEFIRVDDLSDRAGKFSLKNIKVDESYNLSESMWADQGCDYYFSLLDTEEKKLYLNLKKQADRYLTGTEQFQKTEVKRNGENVPVCILPLISYEGLSTSRMKKVFYCFMFENPQYYFMRNSVIYSENTNMMTVGLYELFADGADRAEYTRQFGEQLQAWDEQIDAAGSVLEKEQLIHKLVCEHVTYNENMAADDPDDKEMSQSCISAVLFDKKTVCAGYAQMFALLCGRAGITCVTVTSPGHAWNKVRMGNVWYNVDCTWNDCRGDDTFLNVTDAQLLAADTELQEHILSEEWTNVAPSCTSDLDPETANGADAETNVTAPEKMPDTVVLSSTETGRLSVSFEPVAGCDGYNVQYASNGAMLPADKADAETASCVIDGLKGGKVYYVRVRAYRWNSKGEKVYGAFSKKVKETVI